MRLSLRDPRAGREEAVEEDVIVVVEVEERRKRNKRRRSMGCAFFSFHFSSFVCPFTAVAVAQGLSALSVDNRSIKKEEKETPSPALFLLLPLLDVIEKNSEENECCRRKQITSKKKER